MQTIHLNPDERQAVSRVTEVIEGMLAEGKGVTVTVAEDREYLSAPASRGSARVLAPTRGAADQRRRVACGEAGELELLEDPARVCRRLRRASPARPSTRRRVLTRA
jgi:hypothetical protein